jgi:hypothetical protein
MACRKNVAVWPEMKVSGTRNRLMAIATSQRQHPPMTSHFLCPVQGCMRSRQKVQKGSHGRPCQMVFIRTPEVVLPVAWNTVRSDVE